MSEAFISVNSTTGVQSNSWDKIAEVSNDTSDLGIVTPPLDGYLFVTIICKINSAISTYEDWEIVAGILDIDVDFQSGYGDWPFTSYFTHSSNITTIYPSTYYAPIFCRVSSLKTFEETARVTYRAPGAIDPTNARPLICELNPGDVSFCAMQTRKGGRMYSKASGDIGSLTGIFYGLKAPF